MLSHEKRQRPAPWAQHKQTLKHRWLAPYHAIEYAAEWIAHLLSGSVLLDALEYLGKFSILVAIVFYFAESGDRQKQKHYQAWQVINTAQGKGGSGGRIEALQELNHDRVPLVGVDLGGAFLQGLVLERANLLRADFQRADLRNAVLRGVNLTFANLRTANLRNGNLERANLENAVLEDADLFGVNLSEAKMAQANLGQADLRNADLRGSHWDMIANIRLANIHGVKNAPAGFVDWAISHGAVDVEHACNAGLGPEWRRVHGLGISNHQAGPFESATRSRERAPPEWSF